TADRWYGSRTIRSASTNCLLAARYPTRPPAIANAFDIVRDTARFGYVGSSETALGVPARRNSAYASSTTTTDPSAAACATIASVTSIGNAVPVGLFGEASSTTDGRCREIAAIALLRSSVKSSARRPVTHAVLVSRAYSGYIEYVGANDSAV